MAEVADALRLLEEKIINVIEVIRLKHKRPTSEEIFYELKKQDHDLSIEVFKNSFRNLEDKGIIVNKGKENLESFFVNKNNKIDGVKEIVLDNSDRIDLTSDQNISMRYIAKLEDEIHFLREEIRNKNKIIEVLVGDSVKRDDHRMPSQNHQINTSENKNNFVFPKTVAKEATVTRTKTNHFTHSNRYEILSEDNDSSIIMNHNITTKNNDHNKNNHSNARNIEKVIPGNTTYRDAVKFGKKTFIFGTSMVKGIRNKEFNQHLTKCSAQIRAFPGANLKQLKHYVIPTLVDDTPDVAVIHGGCNDIQSRNGKSLSENEIANEIINIGKVCRENGVNEILISSLICRSSHHLNSKVTKVNDILKDLCYNEGFGFINNINITSQYLWKDGLHLIEAGKVILANNFIHSINNLL